MLDIGKNERGSLKNEQQFSFISPIPRMSRTGNSYQEKLSPSSQHRPSNKPERLHTDFWAPLYYITGPVHHENSP